jgi:hypothetical protein
MKSKLGYLKDGQQFYLSPRKKVLYRLDTVKGGMATFTSLTSGLTFIRPKKTVCYTR